MTQTHQQQSDKGHTPGPWKDRIATGTADHEISGQGAGVCVIPYKYAGGGQGTAIRNANARLIAAAPELLEALTKLEEAASFAAIPDLLEREAVGAALNLARAALRLADRGKQS